jgi:hypothetical protein
VEHLVKEELKTPFKGTHGSWFFSGYSIGTNATYNRINQDLLVELGVEGIITRIVIPKVTALFKPEYDQLYLLITI